VDRHGPGFLPLAAADLEDGVVVVEAEVLDLEGFADAQAGPPLEEDEEPRLGVGGRLQEAGDLRDLQILREVPPGATFR
jgi:hypothetical protein